MILLLAAIMFTGMNEPGGRVDLFKQKNCHFDHSAMMALDDITFDQDPDKGFRHLSDHGCRSEAADAIRDYRSAHPSSWLYTLLTWHEGQVRAADGQYTKAIQLFRNSYKPSKDNSDGWNAYVDATIAFASGKKKELMKAYKILLSTPMPQNADSVDWPPNKGPVERMIKCFGKPYSDLGDKICEPK